MWGARPVSSRLVSNRMEWDGIEWNGIESNRLDSRSRIKSINRMLAFAFLSIMLIVRLIISGFDNMYTSACRSASSSEQPATSYNKKTNQTSKPAPPPLIPCFLKSTNIRRKEYRPMCTDFRFGFCFVFLMGCLPVYELLVTHYLLMTTTSKY